MKIIQSTSYELFYRMFFFNEVLVSSEGELVYMILMDFLRLAGFKISLSFRKSLPLQVAEVLYLSENQQNLEEEVIKYELELMEKAEEYFDKLEIPIAPRNNSLVYKKVKAKTPKNLKDSMMKIRITETIRTRDQKFHITDAILLIIFLHRINRNSQGSQNSSAQLSESNELDMRNRGHQKFPFGPAYSSGGLKGRNLKRVNKVPQNSRNFHTVLSESRSKENLAKTVFKINEKESP